MTIKQQRDQLVQAMNLIIRKAREAAERPNLDYIAGINFAAGVAEGTLEMCGVSFPPTAHWPQTPPVDIETGAQAFCSDEVKP